MSSKIATLINAAKTLAIGAACGLTVATASASVVTPQLAGLQQLYGQWGIEIRYNPAQTIFSSTLLVIDDDAEFNSLSTYEVGGTTLSMFFLDSINYCGAAIVGIVGCASTPGTLIALDSNFMATQPEAATAMGHEIGHNLGLFHLNPVVAGTPDNLMNPETYVGNPAPLNPGQVATIMMSPLIQTDINGQKFLSITPFAVLAPVPEPSSVLLMLLGFGALAWRLRGARQQ